MSKRPELVAISNGGEIKNAGQNGTATKTMAEFYDEVTADVMARTLWGEARGEGSQGMHAVACVIMNRVEISKAKGKFWWGNNVIQVCQKPYQFSCWNRADPNFRKLQQVGEDSPYYSVAMRLAKMVVSGEIKDITNGATHYHSKDIKPYWARDHRPCAVIGSHVFYKLID